MRVINPIIVVGITKMSELSKLIKRLDRAITRESPYIKTIKDPQLLVSSLKELGSLIGNEKVKDATATQVLMTEFYTNLWRKKHGKLEALRQAQLTMLKHFDPVEKKLRGLDLPADTANGPERGSPFYWAAFVLSGDWR